MLAMPILAAIDSAIGAPPDCMPTTISGAEASMSMTISDMLSHARSRRGGDSVITCICSRLAED